MQRSSGDITGPGIAQNRGVGVTTGENGVRRLAVSAGVGVDPDIVQKGDRAARPHPVESAETQWGADERDRPLTDPERDVDRKIGARALLSPRVAEPFPALARI